MLSNSVRSLNRLNRLITVDDMTDSILAGRSAAHTACWKYLQMASYDSALEHSNDIIKREPQKPDGYIFKARALYQLKRFKEAEDALLHVMQIAEQNDLVKSDVEGFIKLKYELAKVRVDLLKSLHFQNAVQISKKFLNNFEASVIDLRTSRSRQLSETCVKTIVESHQNIPPVNHSESHSRYFHNQIPIEAETEMIQISQTEYLHLKESEQLNFVYELEIANLREEMKNVYKKTFEINLKKVHSEQKLKQLERELGVLQKQVDNNERKKRRDRQMKKFSYYKRRLGYHFYGNKPSITGAVRNKIYSPIKGPNLKTDHCLRNTQYIRTIFHHGKYYPIIKPN